VLHISSDDKVQNITVVVGLQFGDEGKGKITDHLSAFHDVVIRYNGGGNAGHTVVTEKGTTKFHLVPSGALRAGTVVLSNGMVIDPIALVEEIKKLKEVNPDVRIEVSRSAHVVTEMHKHLDLAEEDVRKNLRIGTTAQGIGPTYEDKYGRSGIRMSDLLDLSILKEKLRLISRLKQSLFEGSDYLYESKIDDLAVKLLESGKLLKEYLVDSEVTIQAAYDAGKSLMFEGAHGALLDIDFGIYPFVTSSNTIAGALTNDTGFSFRKVKTVVGVAKAYVSKVGNGPFPTEIRGKAAEVLRQIGSEFGTTTGRPRRVGWLDIPALRYSLLLNDADFIALTKLDTLGMLDKIQVGYAYTLNGEPIQHFPKDFRILEKVTVEYKDVQPWGKLGDGILEDVRKNGMAGFPRELREYVSLIEKLSGFPVRIISFGSRRELTFDRSNLGAPDMDQVI